MRSTGLGVALAAALALSTGCGRRQPDAPRRIGPAIEAVRGPSWLQHLGLSLDQTKLGKMGGEGGPPETPRVEPMPQISRSPLGTAIRRFYDRMRNDEEGARSALNEP
ncbi:MAG: hypothetical protein ACM3JH_13070, partial [Acidithiobacillales bacterium]